MLLATAPVGAVAKVAVVAPPKPMTFLLVHGAWHGGWCWKKLTPLLRAAGHNVFAPTLTGCGERAHLLTRETGLDTHIMDIRQVLEYEDLWDVVLVGHSYGGMVIAGVADKAGPRVVQLVYLDAFMPENGKAISDYAPRPFATDDKWHDPSPMSPEGFGVTNEHDIAWMKARFTEMARKALTQPVQLSAGSNRPAKDAFIQCTKAPLFAEAGERAKRNGLRYRELFSAGHDAMVSQPAELAAILLDLLPRT